MISNKKLWLVFLLGVSILFISPLDPDLGWHLKYGEYIFTNLTFLKENIFSYTMPHYMWANSYWLAQLILYSIYRAFGFVGLSLVPSVLLSAVVVFIFTKHASLLKNPLLTITGIIATFVLFSLFGITVRPLLFSTIFMLILIYVLLYQTRFIKYLPLLFLVWVNTHADFTLGLFVFGMFTLFNRQLKYFYILLLAGFSTLINPYFLGLHETLLKEANHMQFLFIAEWRPLLVADYPTFVFGALVIGLALASLRYSYKKYGLWYLITIVLFSLLAIRSNYFLRVLFILSIFPVLEFINFSFRDIAMLINKDSKKLIFVNKLVVFAVFLTVGVSFLNNLYVSSTVERWSNKYKYPHGAVSYIKDNNLEGRIFNEYVWGGYLIWFLPGHQTFIDGRMPSWREGDYSIFEEYANYYIESKDVSYFVDKYDISFILVKKTETDAVRYEHKVLYEDDFSILYEVL